MSYLHEDGTLYAGDAAGVRIEPGRFVYAPTVPPEVDLEVWERTLDELERREARRLALIHFGVFDDVERHVAALRETTHAWGERVAHGMDEPTFVAAARADVASAEPGEVDAYDHAAPYWHCYLGLERYWRKRAGRLPVLDVARETIAQRLGADVAAPFRCSTAAPCNSATTNS